MIVCGNRLDCVDIVVGDANEPCHQGFEPGLRFARTGCRQGGQRAPVPSALHDDDLRIRNATLMSVKPCDFDRAFVRLGARVAKKHIVHVGDPAQLVRESRLFGNVDQIRCVDDATSLLGDGVSQFWVGVAES